MTEMNSHDSETTVLRTETHPDGCYLHKVSFPPRMASGRRSQTSRTWEWLRDEQLSNELAELAKFTRETCDLREAGAHESELSSVDDSSDENEQVPPAPSHPRAPGSGYVARVWHEAQAKGRASASGQPDTRRFTSI